MPNSVVMLSSDEAKRNLSDETYAAFEETPIETYTPLLSGGRSVRLGNRRLLRTDSAVELDNLPDEWVIVLNPNPRACRKRPRTATVKENLNTAEVSRMLSSEENWKLAVPNGSSTDVLTRPMLEEAWGTDASGTVKASLRQANNNEQAVLDDAKERLSPKGGAARLSAAVTAPITNIGLVATAAAGFVAWKGDEIARPWLAVVAALSALVAVGLALLGSNLLKKSNVNLSRLDVLEKHSASLGPSLWLTRIGIVALLVAIGAALFSIFPAKSSAVDPTPSFSEPATTEMGSRTKVEFTVTWKNLGKDEAKARTTVTREGETVRRVVTPKDSEGTATRQLSITTPTPTTLIVRTQALDTNDQPVGDTVEHTYNIP